MPSKSYRRRYRKNTSKKYTKNKAFVKAVSKIVDSKVEHKYKTGFEVARAIDIGGQVLGPYTVVSQGLTDTDRVGDQITVKSLYVTVGIYPPSVSINKESNFVRLIMFQWKLSSITNPLTNDILSSPSGTIDTIFCQYDHDKIGKAFTILYDKTFTITNNETGGQNSQKFVKFRVPLKYAKRKVNYISGGNDAFNHIYMLAISDSAVTGHPEITLTARMHYVDA